MKKSNVKMDIYTCAAQGEFNLTSNILAIFENEELRIALEQWANKHNCRIHWGDPSSADICAIPNFVMIVDRSILGTNVYDDYLKLCKGTLNVKIVKHSIIYADGTEELFPQPEDNNDIGQENLIGGEDVEDDWLIDDICLFVDGLIDIPLPQVRMVQCIKPITSRFTEWVIVNVEMAKKTVLERVYSEYRDK